MKKTKFTILVIILLIYYKHQKKKANGKKNPSVCEIPGILKNASLQFFVLKFLFCYVIL